ncbi:MAG: ATP-binding cassette domain-containing protein, partial [Bacteroidales bacterium]|nr:ATP-binding cassette domain-containing protein [Bacteroidales bacterium]
MRKIGVKDLLAFMLQSIRVKDISYLLALTGIVTVLGMLIPYVNKQLFDTVIPDGTKSDIIPVAALLVGVSVGVILFNLIRDWCLLYIRQLVDIRVEPAVMARTFFLKPSFFMKYSSGELSERTGSINSLCSIIGNILLGTSFTAIFHLVYIFQMNIYAQKLVFPAMAVLLAQMSLSVVMFFFHRAVSKKSLKASAKLTSLIYDLINGIVKVKLTGSRKRAFTRWFETYRESASLNFNPPFIIKVSGALSMLLNMGGIGLLYFIAARNNITPSDYIGFSTAYGMVSGALMQFIQMAPSLAEIEPLLELAGPIMEAEPEIDEKSRSVGRLTGAVEVCHLSFRYSDEEPLILDDFSLKISPGEYIGIVGKSGCGKNTLTKLLLGFEKPQSGAIYYDNYDLKELDKSSIRQKIGTCLQSGTLFPGNVFSNLTITSPWSTMSDAWEAARLVGMDEFIKELPMGMSTLISEGGGGFSGGQKQRLLIARALINRPSVLLFDEATSALDNITQKQISESLDSLKSTRIVIAHRLSTSK